VDAIYSIDTGIGQIMTALESTDLDEVTILGLGSDHGMQDLLPEGKSAPDTAHILDLRSILENAEFIVDKWRASGPRMSHVFLADPSSAASAKSILEATPGIERAFTKSELDGADLGGDMIAYLNHKKSGDVIAFAEAEFSMGRSVIQSPADGLDNPSKYYWDGSNDYRGGHGGLTTMEQYVPFIVWGEAIEPNCSLGPRYNVDWAPTIAAFFEIDPPNDSEGTAVLDCLRSR
jgi:arylsulfatase A-like enzyme